MVTFIESCMKGPGDMQTNINTLLRRRSSKFKIRRVAELQSYSIVPNAEM